MPPCCEEILEENEIGTEDFSITEEDFQSWLILIESILGWSLPLLRSLKMLNFAGEIYCGTEHLVVFLSMLCTILVRCGAWMLCSGGLRNGGLVLDVFSQPVHLLKLTASSLIQVRYSIQNIIGKLNFCVQKSCLVGTDC